MKNLFKTGLLSVSLLATVVVSAAEKMSVKVLGTKALNVSLQGVANGELLSIVDKSGITLFSETLDQSDKFEKTFDLTYLPEGVYFLESNQSNKIDVSPILIADNKVTLISDASKVYNEPRIVIDEKMVKVVLDNSSKANVVIIVSDSLGQELFRTETIDTENIYKKLDFSVLPAGSKYSISVKEDDYYFVKDITL